MQISFHYSFTFFSLHFCFQRVILKKLGQTYIFLSLFNFLAEVPTSWIIENKDVSYANSFAFDDKPSARSLI